MGRRWGPSLVQEYGGSCPRGRGQAGKGLQGTPAGLVGVRCVLSGLMLVLPRWYGYRYAGTRCSMRSRVRFGARVVMNEGYSETI